MKIHYPQSHYTKTHRGQLFPLLKVFIKGSEFTDAERVKMYQISAQEVNFVEKPKEELLINSINFNLCYLIHSFF